jgi:hypothetical protein
MERPRGNLRLPPRRDGIRHALLNWSQNWRGWREALTPSASAPYGLRLHRASPPRGRRGEARHSRRGGFPSFPFRFISIVDCCPDASGKDLRLGSDLHRVTARRPARFAEAPFCARHAAGRRGGMPHRTRTSIASLPPRSDCLPPRTLTKYVAWQGGPTPPAWLQDLPSPSVWPVQHRFRMAESEPAIDVDDDSGVAEHRAEYDRTRTRGPKLGSKRVMRFSTKEMDHDLAREIEEIRSLASTGSARQVQRHRCRHTWRRALMVEGPRRGLNAAWGCRDGAVNVRRGAAALPIGKVVSW